MSDKEYEEYNALDGPAKNRYMEARAGGNGHVMAIVNAKDEALAKAKRAVGLANGTASDYERVKRQIERGYGDPQELAYLKKELRKRRSELIAIDKEIGSGATGMRVRLALQHVRMLLK